MPTLAASGRDYDPGGLQAAKKFFAFHDNPFSGQ
jgi:hypothetical protein